METKKGIKNLVIAIILTVGLMFSSIVNVFAAADTITLGAGSKVKSYIAGVTFSYKLTTDGKYLYCLNINKKTAANVKANIVRNSKKINGGVVYLLKNGYPNKSITGDKEKDYYITQTALWWYLDLTTGSANLGAGFKETGSDAYNLRHYVKDLVYDAYNHRNDPIGTEDTSLTLGFVNGESTLNKDFYISKEIMAVKNSNIENYTVTLKDAPTGTSILSSNGLETVYSGAFSVGANDKFRIKVPLANMTGTKSAITISAKATGVSQYMAYEYQPVDTTMQDVALFEKTEKEICSDLVLDIVSTKVIVSKIDADTRQPIAGAKLVLKDQSGKEITSWTSTINAHIIRNLAYGTYTVEEIAAPQGYRLNTNKSTITLSAKQPEIKVNFQNAALKVVVNIIKVDQTTNAPLAGAVLAVKNSSGAEIARFTTTTAPYVLTDLAKGIYTVEEISAPAGYVINKTPIAFTIDDNHLSQQVTMVNAKETIVPDTADIPSILMVIIGVIITGLGLSFIKKHA